MWCTAPRSVQMYSTSSCLKLILKCVSMESVNPEGYLNSSCMGVTCLWKALGLANGGVSGACEECLNSQFLLHDSVCFTGSGS